MLNGTRKGTTVALGVLGSAAVLALGFAVAGLASSSDVSGVLASTTETPTKHRAVLTGGAEVPKPTGLKAGAAGTFTVSSVAKQGGKYVATFKLSYRNLTGKAVAAHIHKGKPGKAGPVLVALCGPCTSGKSGKVTITKAAETAIETGGTYVNVHTAKNAAGEIRGQVKKAG